MFKKIALAFVAMFVLAGCSSSNYKQDPAHLAEFQNIGNRVYFKLNGDCLSASAIQTLEQQVVWLKKHDLFQIKLEGHSDVRGTKAYNIALGERRANTVKKYLIEKGIDAARISVVSYGKERPVAAGNNEEAHSQNRRVVVNIQ